MYYLSAIKLIKKIQMKRFTLLALSLIMALSLSAQNSIFFPQEGKTLNYQITTKSVMGTQTVYSVQYSQIDEDGDLVVTTDIYMSEEDDNPAQSMDVVYTRVENGYAVNFADIMQKTMEAQMPGLKIGEVEDDMVFPDKLSFGMTFPDLALIIKAPIQGQEYEMNLTNCNRKVKESKEKVSVPAGEFECFVITGDTIVTIMGMDQVTKSTEYYAEGVGLVKQVTEVAGATVTNELISVE